ncbi:MAG TPA: TolC family protein [Polyangiaceae bacterium]
MRPPELEVSDPMLEDPPAAPNQLSDWRQALKLIRSNSSLLKTARSQVDVARGQARQALAPALPSLTGDAQINHHLLRGEGVDIFATPPQTTSLPDPATTWNAGLNLRVPLLASKAWYDRGTAKQAINARQLEAQDAERLTVGDVANAIIQVVTAERAAEVSRVSLRSALSNLELNRRRARLGSASAVDVLRMEQEVERARQQVINADEAIRRSRENLGLALGTSDAWGVAPNISLDALAVQARNSCEEQKSIDARLDVRAAEANAEIARRNVKSVDYLYVPTIDGVSSATYWSDANRTANGESVTWTIGAVLSWNIYDGGFRYGTRQVNEAQLAIAQESVIDRKREARVEVDRALRSIRVAEANLVVSTRAAEIARQSARFAQITFLNGTGTSFDMVDTARTQREAELDVTLKEFELLRAKITAFLSLASCQV